MKFLYSEDSSDSLLEDNVGNSGDDGKLILSEVAFLCWLKIAFSLLRGNAGVEAFVNQF